MKPNQLKRKISIIEGRLDNLKHLLVTSGIAYDFKILDPIFSSLRGELKKQHAAFIKDADKPVVPRSTDKILKDVLKEGQYILDDDLKAEIEQVIKKSKKKK